jgi:hypothetical protein
VACDAILAFTFFFGFGCALVCALAKVGTGDPAELPAAEGDAIPADCPFLQPVTVPVIMNTAARTMMGNLPICGIFTDEPPLAGT